MCHLAGHSLNRNWDTSSPSDLAGYLIDKAGQCIDLKAATVLNDSYESTHFCVLSINCGMGQMWILQNSSVMHLSVWWVQWLERKENTEEGVSTMDMSRVQAPTIFVGQPNGILKVVDNTFN